MTQLSLTPRPVSALEIGPLRVWSPVLLAPMAGVTDAPFRRLCREFGEQGLPEFLRPASSSQDSHSKGGTCVPVPGVDAPAGLYVMEMVTSRALVEGNARTWEMVRPDPAERVRSIQLYGVNPTTMAKATQLLIERDLVDHLDLNFGCPVPKVTRKGGGAALPWKKDLFEDLVHAVVDAANRAGSRAGRDVPVTVKMRVGIDEEHVTFLEAARIAQRRGVAAIALHARTQVQHYSGQAHWEQIARLKEAVSLPVFGNGDVFSGKDAARMMAQTGCDAVVIGRGCQGRPWLFADIVSTLMGGPEFQDPGLAQIVTIIERHARWIVADQGDEARAMREMRKHIGWYLRGFAVGGATRHALSMVSSMEELHEQLMGLDLDQSFPKAAEGPRGRAGGQKLPHLPQGWLASPFLTEAERSQLHLAEDGADGG